MNQQENLFNEPLPQGLKPPRPKITDEMVLEAATELLRDAEIDGDPQDVVKVFESWRDGYQLARELETTFHWDANMQLAEELDCLGFSVDRIHEKAVREWMQAYNIQPQLENGTAIDKGVIAGVSDSSPGYYRVKANGCTEEGRFLLIPFEVAESTTLSPLPAE